MTWDSNNTYYFFIIESEDIGYSSIWKMVNPVLVEEGSTIQETLKEMWDETFSSVAPEDWDWNYHFEMIKSPLTISILDTSCGRCVFDIVTVGG